ncbi:hypothetical protein ACIOUF_11085 [Pseudomonas iridis]|uniref:Uncharacterized protein n=1 Tax=Pseudomonas iridis TaxID=2710587 RepID=A0ABW8DI40_9PSED|nr:MULTISPECIES: hypothetical protein [Pseudomonas]CEL30104.1 hypothetical protein SRM1_03458 [Pseudomonas fluorescens]
MGYMSSWNANKIVELDEEQARDPEHIEALQLSEEELAELDAQ